MATLAGTMANANTREHHEIHIKRGKEVKEEIGKGREIVDIGTRTGAGVEVKDTIEKMTEIAIEAVIERENIGVEIGVVKNVIGGIMTMRTGRGGIDIELVLVLGEGPEIGQDHDPDLVIKGASEHLGLIWLHLVQWLCQELHCQCGRHPEPRGLFCLYTGVPTMGLIYNEDLIHLCQLVGVPQTMPGVLPGTFPFAGTQFGTFSTMPMQAMTQQATRHARRVYVGGLPPLANEQKIATFFSQVMTAIGGNTAGPGDAVVNVYINHEKNFAFVEMRTVEEASNAMALDGIMFEGMSVRVRRPTDYNPSLAATLGPSQPSPHLNLAAVGLTPGIVGGADGPDKIFVGGLPYYLTEAQIKELLESFGPLRGFDLVKDRETGNSKGYAFCVYQDPAVTDVACAALNGLKMGDKTLTVRRATASGQPKPDQEIVIMQAQQQIAIQKLALQATSASAIAFGGLPGLMTGLMPGTVPGIGNGISATEVPTKVVCLTQLVAVDDLRDDSEFEDIYEDIKEECGKYGSVVKLMIPRPNPTGEEVPGLGKAFVEYTDTQGSSKAKASLNGRKFAGNTVVAVYYPEDKFAKGEFGG